jgi:SAM-dependent methyltransferase
VEPGCTSPARVRAFTPLRALIFRRALRAALAGCRSVLDVGCGAASPLGAARFRGFTIGTDVHRPALLAARARGVHRALVQADATDVARIFRPGSVDAVVALDLVEHLERGVALALIGDLERIARRRVVVFTPNGFVPQPPAPDNPHQAHRSGFSVAEMRALGYRVRGMGGLWYLSGPFGEVRLPPAILWRRIADLTAPLVYPAARFAFALLCVKEVSPTSANERDRRA